MAPRPSRNHLLLILILLLPATALASGGETAPDGKPPAADATDRIYAVSGVTISWDLENERFRAPTAAEAARLAAAFAPPASEEEIKVETLPDGTEKVRVPFYLLSASQVGVGSEGEMAGFCEEPATGTTKPAAGVEEE